MAQRQIFDLVFRDDLAELFLNVLPLVIAPEVVEKNEAAAHDVLAQAQGLFGWEFHEARLDDVEDRVIKDAIVENFEGFGTRRDL